MKPLTLAVLLLLALGITVSVQAQTVTGAVVGPTYYAPAYGVVAGAGNQCTNMTSLLTTVNATGGSIVFDAGTTVLSSCNLVLGPNVFLVGRGATNDDFDTIPPSPPTILKMTSTTTGGLPNVAHFECLSYGGQCGAVNLTVQDDSTTLPFFLYTGGVPHLDNVTCWGMNNRISGQQPVNDCVWFGNFASFPTPNTCGNPSVETDGFCGYGLASVNVYCHNTRRCLAFGSNANGITADVFGDYTDAFVDESFMPKGGFVEFAGSAGTPSNYTSYGNRVSINMEMAPNHSMQCNYLGAFRMISYATNNIVTYDGSDVGNCQYTGRIEDTTSGWNRIIAQFGVGSMGDVYNFGAGSDNNIIESLQSRILTWQTMMTGTLGSSSKPVNSLYLFDWFGQPRTTAGLSGTTAYKASWISDSTDGTCTSAGMGPIKVLCFYDGTQWQPMGNLSSPTFTAPHLGSAAALSLTVTGTLDGHDAVYKDTTMAVTVGSSYQREYHFNQYATAIQPIVYSLPAAGAGKKYCFFNSNGGSPNTGALRLNTSNPTQQVIDPSGGISIGGGYIISGGSAGDAGCVEGLDSSTWQFYSYKGTWTAH